MPTCPFCQTPISENLSLYGGACPSCLIEIPGEEAVTDPGVTVELTEESRRATGGSGAIMGVAIAGLVILAGAAGWFYSQDTQTVPATQAQANLPISGFAEHQDAAFKESQKAQRRSRSSARRSSTQRVTSRGQPPSSGRSATADASVVPAKKGLVSHRDGKRDEEKIDRVPGE